MPRIVLIVEDSQDCAETLEIALESVPGIRTVVARNTRQAREILARAAQDAAAVITDLNLEKLSAFDFIEWLRANESTAAIPIILITGDSDPEVRALATSHGVNAFFPKPYSPAEVRRKLENLLC